MGTLIVVLLVLVIAAAIVAVSVRSRRRGHVMLAAPPGERPSDPEVRP
jgi:hypothetical protein